MFWFIHHILSVFSCRKYYKVALFEETCDIIALEQFPDKCANENNCSDPITVRHRRDPNRTQNLWEATGDTVRNDSLTHFGSQSSKSVPKWHVSLPCRHLDIELITYVRTHLPSERATFFRNNNDTHDDTFRHFAPTFSPPFSSWGSRTRMRPKTDSQQTHPRKPNTKRRFCTQPVTDRKVQI